ncbi:hypothetical protein ABZ816_34950 [Actinosynnema sp. NPDC047251]|uniref:Putative secreted protein n=1 Tax=Saccharothrix espanaensis (strain ATCC 51144 / DSM 44229 / JCM 9112 / NBRC 15066 / NRRL 15764) TaxID=1179773 RepID=K0JSX9_SACES|nr:hypothetical protein [Saccharothrix espanaensis]CCH28597.1 putative secreted protein [Saccharothrix espanaensis DSM 44229]
MAAWASLVVSLLALTVSAVTLWRAQLTPFRLLVTADQVQLRIHQMESETGETWLLPHFALSVGFANSGTQVGRVLGVRLVLRYTSLPIPDAYEVFACHGEYDPVKYQAHGGKRFTMIDQAKLGDFHSFVVLPKATASKFYVFTVRWDKPVRQAELRLDLEVLHDRSTDWKTTHTWQLAMPGWAWNSVEQGSSFTFVAEGGAAKRSSRDVNPPDLHKYTLDEEMRAVTDDSVSVVREITPD